VSEEVVARPEDAVTTNGHADPTDDVGAPPADDVTDEPAATPPSRAGRFVEWLGNVHPAMWLTLAGVVVFAAVFGTLGVRHHEHYGSWSFDLGIYDQGYWLVSRGGETFMTVRGLEFWGQHINLVALLYVPFYWLGAGPAFLYISQAIVLGLGALPVYLIARDRFHRPWIGLTFAVAFLMYAPIQWISWANYHPEALVITPFLFAWWFSMHKRWGWFFVFIGLALATREDTAMAVFMLGIVLLVMNWRGSRLDRRMAIGTMVLGVLWYLITTQLLIPWANDGRQPFYLEYFYGSYGGSIPEIAGNILRHPDRVVRDGIEPDRIRFYRDLLLPWGGLPLLAPLQLLMALPQMLASVIGASPYARMIKYQYTAVMIAPIVIAAIEGAHKVWRFRIVRRLLIPYVLIWAYVTNVAWSNSPIGNEYSVWVQSNARQASLDHAVSMVPDDASVTATYGLLPHLSHRERIYDWPNPFQPAYWGNDDTYRLPDPSTIQYLVIDRQQVGEAQKQLLSDLTDGDPYRILFDQQDVVVAQRVAPG
jgi:uncharacterized membrane protein